MEHVNSQTLEMYRQKVEKAVNKKHKKDVAAKICTPLGYFIFVAYFILTTCNIIGIMSACMGRFAFTCEWFEGAWLWLAPWPCNGWLVFGVIVALLVSTMFVPLLIVMFIAGLIHIFTPNKTLTVDMSQPVPCLKKLRDEASNANKSPHANLDDIFKHPLLLALFLFYVGSAAVLYLGSPEPDATEKLLIALLGPVFLAVFCFLPLFLAYLFFDTLLSGFLTKTVKNAYKLHTEISKLYNKEKGLVEKEQAAIRAAQEAKEAAERKAEGTRIYEQAVAADAADEALIKRTADMGCEEARLAYAKILLLKFFSNMFTNEEEVNIMKQIEKYLNPIRHKTVETEFLWLYAHTYDASLSKEELTDVLQQFRVISASGQLPEEYTDLLNAEIKDVISTINKFHDAPPPSRAPSRPVHQQTSSSRPMTFSEKEEYIRRRFGAIYSYAAIEAIDSDPNLTPSQKEALKQHLLYMGD